MVKTLPSTAGGVGSIPVWGAKIPQASWSRNQNIKQKQGFPGGSVVKNLLANAGDTGLSPGQRRSHMPRNN